MTLFKLLKTKSEEEVIDILARTIVDGRPPIELFHNGALIFNMDMIATLDNIEKTCPEGCKEYRCEPPNKTARRSGRYPWKDYVQPKGAYNCLNFLAKGDNCPYKMAKLEFIKERLKYTFGSEVKIDENNN